MVGDTTHRATVAMPEARRIDTTPPVRISAADIPTQGHAWPSQMLRCAHCEAKVQAIDSTPKERTRPRRPYFRRTPRRGGGNRHAAECLYNVAERIRVIRAESDDSLRRDRSRNGRPRYRLVLPEAFGPAELIARGSRGEQVVAERLTTVLNTAAKIAALLEDYAERDADIDMEWSAECGGERVEWLNFLYVPQRIWVLHRRLEREGPALGHPTAVVFRATECESSTSSTGVSRSCAGTYALPPEPGSPEVERLAVVGEHELIERVFAQGTSRFYIGYGMWFRERGGPVGPTRLRLHIYSAAQVADISDEVGDRPLSRWRQWRRLRDLPGE
ncbi:hypothetical protein JK358_37460 [Nocardia sp. 2]|uniref:Uncharacterized protein n=1 Tax=Nocardia acididurans TaxID=2802282 RepID=A0ABS1MJ71_9NOCA|nr:hypothetical protein [Nocardia acididurans]MBL1080100.1 hypothetical protein [Nocardia acididurans]